MTKKEEIELAMRDRKVAYVQIFKPETTPGKAVIEDLSKFCRQNISTFHPNERVHCLLEGRREVMIRILDFLQLPVDELCKKYGGSQWELVKA